MCSSGVLFPTSDPKGGTVVSAGFEALDGEEKRRVEDRLQQLVIFTCKNTAELSP